MRTRSPFPGMDPWLESHWNGVHPKIIGLLQRQLNSQLPGDLYAEIEENVYVVDVEPERRLFRPDVAVFETGGEIRIGDAISDDGGVAIAEPVRLTFTAEPITEGFIQIRELREGNPLVTVIEVISPTNKIDVRGRAAYLAKRAAYVAAKVNIVELDLLRGGDHIVGIPPEYIDPTSLAPFKCAVRRATGSGAKIEIDYFSFALRRRLPKIRVPLRPGDQDAIVDLQEPIDVAYEEGRFGLRIDYTKPPEPPLSPDDAAWANELVFASK